MHQIETGTRSSVGKDCVFVWFYCRDGVPYRKYLPPSAPDVMPMVLVLLRWDGTFGTVGGKVDAGESLLDALARETYEESGYRMPSDAAPEPLGTFVDGDWHIHSFSLERAHSELVAVRAEALAAARATPECAGLGLAPAGRYQAGEHNAPRGIQAFSENRFCSTAKLEFDLLLQRIHGTAGV